MSNIRKSPPKPTPNSTVVDLVKDPSTPAAAVLDLVKDPSTLRGKGALYRNLRTVIAISLLATVALAVPTIARAQEAVPNPSLEVAQLVQQLTSSPSFEARERAMHQLWQRYETARPQVEQLAQAPDPEVARRGRWILKRWEIGLLPELPWDIRKRLAGASNDPAAAFETLIDSRRLREASEVARMASQGNNSLQQQTQLQLIVIERYTDLVHIAVESDQMDSLLSMLDSCANTKRLAVARAILIHRLGRNLDEQTILATCTKSLPTQTQTELAATCWATIGEFDRSITLAKTLPTPELLAQVLLVGERWEELADLSSRCVEDTLPPDATITQYATWLIAAKFAGDEQQVEKVAKILSESEGRAPLRWKALAAVGQLDQAIEQAKEIDPIAAVDLLRTQMRFDEAFALLEVDPANPNPDLQRLLSLSRQIISSFGTENSARPADASALDKLAMALELLYAVGITDPVDPILIQLSQIRDGQQELRGLNQALPIARKLNRNDVIPQLLSILGKPGAIQLERLPYIVVTSFSQRSVTLFRQLAHSITKHYPSRSAEEQWQIFLKLTSGEIPEDLDRQTDLDAIYELMSEQSDDNPRNPLMGGSTSYSIAEFFVALGRPDIAEECYMRAIGPLENPVAAMEFAKYQLDAGNPETALVLLDMVAESSRSPIFNQRYLLADPSDAVIPTLSSVMLAKSIALRRLGRSEEAELIDKTLAFAPLQPAANAGEDYLSHLVEFSELERLKADAPFELRISAIHERQEQQHQHYFQFSEAAFALKENDPETSFRWHRLGFASSLSGLAIYSRFFAIIPSTIYSAEALAAAERGDEAATRSALQRSLIQYPVDISLGEDTLLEIRKSGFDKLADEVTDQIFESGLKYVSKYSSDASTLNNLAWISAINGRNYQKSLELAQLAVFLEPDSVSYRDTLAEILYRQGKTDEAISVEQQCLIDAPAHWHLHEQIERFRNEQPPVSEN